MMWVDATQRNHQASVVSLFVVAGNNSNGVGMVQLYFPTDKLLVYWVGLVACVCFDLQLTLFPW